MSKNVYPNYKQIRLLALQGLQLPEIATNLKCSPEAILSTLLAYDPCSLLQQMYPNEEANSTPSQYVIDFLSIPNKDFWNNLLAIISIVKRPIVVTTTMIKKLEGIQYPNSKKEIANEILNKIEIETHKQSNIFCIVCSSKNSEYESDMINYCKQHKDAVLLTYNQKVILKALIKSINYWYLCKTPQQTDTSSDNDICTLYNTTKKGKKLTLSCTNPHKAVYVLSNGRIFAVGPMVSHNLKVGEDIYIIKYDDRKNTLCLSHYRIINLSSKNNSLFINSYLYNKDSNPDNIPDEYKNFIKMAIAKFSSLK